MSVIARLGLASANLRVRRVSARQLGPDRNITVYSFFFSLEMCMKTFLVCIVYLNANLPIAIIIHVFHAKYVDKCVKIPIVHLSQS